MTTFIYECVYDFVKTIVVFSKGNGVSYPVQARDEDSDRLLDAGAESDVLSGPDEDEERNHKGAGKFLVL